MDIVPGISIVPLSEISYANDRMLIRDIESKKKNLEERSACQLVRREDLRLSKIEGGQGSHYELELSKWRKYENLNIWELF